MKYSTINVQGNLISEEILQNIEKSVADGQLVTDFGFEPSANIRSEIEYAWSRVKLDWKYFNERSQNLPAKDPYGTTLSRNWIKLFLSSIGFELERPESPLKGDNLQNYTISHIAENLDQLPVHIVGFIDPTHPDKNTLDMKSSGGTSRYSPHGTMQEYLNVTEHVYGIAANGLYLRLIRDSGRLIKLTYVEFDLKRMMDEDKYSEFTLLYRLIHASRFPRKKEEADQSILEKYYQDSIETGNRIRDGLSKAVKESLLALGTGFLQNEFNTALREKIISGKLSHKDYYRQLLRIIYRFLFLMVTEERDLVYDPDDKTEEIQKNKKIYLQFYSIYRLRKLSECNFVFEEQYNDLWQGLVNTFILFEAGGKGKKLGIQPLDGDLFSSKAIPDLEGSLINNKLLLECVKNLNEFKDENRNLVAINYRSLDVEELGSVYEGLLELHPVIENIEASNPNHINFTFHEGTDRKTTGSYYTRPELVNELIKSALIPVIEERLKEHTGNKEAQAKALLKLKVCDAAAGSGHMLLAAARTIAWYLARVQSGEENPAPSVYRKCLREVIQHCIYAVDYNPDAVELCKLALWLEGHNSGKPLSFLDHKIRNGNSLVGVTDLIVLQNGIPDDAFNPVTGDDKEVCKELKKGNATYRKTRQTDLFSAQGQQIKKDSESLKSAYAEMEGIEQDSVEAVQQVKKRFGKFRESVFHEEKACHMWTSAYFKTYTSLDDPTNPSSERLAQYFYAPTQYSRLIGEAEKLNEKHKFFHWPLEFPDVFEQGGFDVMLGNPPWESVQLEEKQFFATKNPEISKLKGEDRKKAIQNLKGGELFKEFEFRKHEIDSEVKFYRTSGQYPLSASGKVNTYSLFTELTYKLINKNGMVGIIIPTGISSDESTKDFFEDIMKKNRLVKMVGFENEEFIFPDVANVVRFCLFILTGSNNKKAKAVFSFNLRNIGHMNQSERSFSVSKEDLDLFNPNSKTCPIFRTNNDYLLSKKIYSKYPVIHNEISNQNYWGISFSQGHFNLTADSKLFLNSPNSTSVPLYEAKIIWHFDHRFSSYEFKGVLKGKGGRGLPDMPVEYLTDSAFRITPQNWVPSKLVTDNTPVSWNKKWFFTFRDIANFKLERTAIAAIVPFYGIGNSLPIIYFENESTLKITCFLSNFNSLIFDYLVRQKVSGSHLNFFLVKQFSAINTNDYTQEIIKNIVPLVFELVFTSWDIKAFADDVWKDADEDLKAAITKQWEGNKSVTCGHEWAPPDWCEIDEAGCPLPPFKWDESRRAILKAELDAIYAKLYGLTTEELRYILDPQDVYGPDFPGETFRVLKEKEIRLYGEYRTRRLVLEAWERLNKNESN
jgi:hypothetical protein